MLGRTLVLLVGLAARVIVVCISLLSFWQYAGLPITTIGVRALASRAFMI
jgi:hypothetical protein